MRILVLTHEYPPVGGGGGRVAQDICEGLAAKNHHLYVLTAQYEDQPAIEHKENLTIQRLRSGRTQAFRAGLIAMLGYVLASLWHGVGVVRRWKPDVIHVHFAVPAGAAGWALSVLTGVPYVLTAHLGDVPGTVPDKTGGWFRWVYPLTPPIWKKAAAVTAVSEFTRQSALKHYKVPIRVIYNGVDLNKIDPGVIQVHKPPRIVFAGRLMHQKNPVRIIEILSDIKHLDWQCTIAGDGPLKLDVEQAIRANKLEDRITMPGWIKPEQVLEEFSRSDILLMPSFSEGLPVVGVQAAAMGLALVVSRAGGNIDLVEEEVNGFLLDPTDKAAFVEKLKMLLKHPARLLEMRTSSRDFASKFDIHAILEAYLQVFSSACRKD